MMRNVRNLFFGAALLSIGTVADAQGRVVAWGDDWTLANGGFTSGDAGAFARNVAEFFTEGKPSGSFLVHSSNFGLTQSSLEAAITGAGHTWTVDTSTPLDIATLLNNYDGVFLMGKVNNATPDNQLLIQYVRMGGNVYLGGGAGGFNGGAGEAQAWNTFLRAFGLSFEELPYNGVVDVVTVTPPMTPPEHPILAGVGRLFFNNGNNVLADATAQALVGGLLGVSESAPFQPFGLGCPGSAGVPVLGASPDPKIDSAFDSLATNLPMNSPLIALAVGLDIAEPPLDLGIFGVFNCTFYIDITGPLGLARMIQTGTQASVAVPIPNDPSIVGLIFYLQAVVQDAAAPNPVGFIVTNAVKGVVGSK